LPHSLFDETCNKIKLSKGLWTTYKSWVYLLIYYIKVGCDIPIVDTQNVKDNNSGSWHLESALSVQAIWKPAERCSCRGEKNKNGLGCVVRFDSFLL
jgi:hypothetical protein